MNILDNIFMLLLINKINSIKNLTFLLLALLETFIYHPEKAEIRGIALQEYIRSESKPAYSHSANNRLCSSIIHLL